MEQGKEVKGEEEVRSVGKKKRIMGTMEGRNNVKGVERRSSELLLWPNYFPTFIEVQYEIPSSGPQVVAILSSLNSN